MKIAILDDHLLLCQSLNNLLLRYDDIEVCDIYMHPQKLLDALVHQQYDVLVLDIMLPEMNGIDLLVELRKRNVSSKILFLSSITEVPTIRQVLRSGAHGYMSKDCQPEELYDALITLYDGGTYIGSNLRNILMRRIMVEEQQVYCLSPREKEVLQHICSGKTIKEAAFEIGLSPHTVQSYHKSIMRKFNLNRSVDLIVFAINNGLYYTKMQA